MRFFGNRSERNRLPIGPRWTCCRISPFSRCSATSSRSPQFQEPAFAPWADNDTVAGSVKTEEPKQIALHHALLATAYDSRSGAAHDAREVNSDEISNVAGFTLVDLLRQAPFVGQAAQRPQLWAPDRDRRTRFARPAHGQAVERDASEDEEPGAAEQ